MSAKEQSFLNYPPPREGPSVPYKHEDQVIPVFRGTSLAIGATLIHNIGFIQSHFWRSAGFGIIREIPHLSQYPGRYDPTVIPVDNDRTAESAKAAFPAIQRRKGNRGYHTSADYHALYKSGELTPTAVIETLLPLVRRDVQPPGKHSTAFLESQAELVRAAAEASTERYKNGQSLGPLDGVPVAVKDEVHLTGYKRTLGSKLDFKHGTDETSWCVRQWLDAGAIVIGKTSMHELGLDTNNNNPNYGTPRNPHNKEYYCGGSSGGSGYAVGAGLVPIALGADGGGSIRIPSSFCGIWGLKPSHGRISGAPSQSLAPTVGVLGPMASNIDDLALAYRTMAIPAPASEDPISSQFPYPTPPSPTDTTRPKTIGIVRAWIDRAEPPVRAVLDRSLAYYREHGYNVIDIEIPYLPEGQRAHVLTIMAEIASGVDASKIKHLTAPNKVLVSMGMYQITAQDLLASQRLRNLLMTHLAHLFKIHPGLMIVTPTTPIPGWHIDGGEADLVRGLSDGKSSVRNMEFVWLANFMGCPAISCPAGYTDGNVPIGIMAMGEWGTEEELIAFARDGEGILDLATGDAEDTGVAAVKGLRTPSDDLSVWEDVIEQAKGKMSV
ncbi:Amidase [Penicillium bovifimosum]|uniref:Amidase n=1 Tax=Penicillium bovifimosum TaxID=126998 RepID=A0A9W9GWE5_9EURO|nr:Amidase [Penicillium bovifimosum]KAJ5131295.1 Amidase [Penicillium bovifimosum]